MIETVIKAFVGDGISYGTRFLDAPNNFAR